MADKPVAAVAPDGTPITLPASKVSELKASGGRVMSAQEAAVTQDEIKFDMEHSALQHPLRAIEDVYGAAATSTWRGLTGGLSDVALVKGAGLLGGESGADAVRSRLNDYRRAHPLMSAADELGGFTAATIATGGGAAAETALGRVGMSALRGGAELSLYEAGKAASDSVLANEDLSAQKIVAGFGHGALLGAAGGALFGGLGEAFAGVRGARAAAAAETRAAGREIAEATEGGGGGTLARKAQQIADEHTIKAFGGSANDVRLLQKNVRGGYQRVAQDIRADFEASTGKTIGSAPSREALHDWAAARKVEVAEKNASLLKSLDESGVGIAPSAERFAQRVQSEVLDKYMVRNAAGQLTAAPGAKKIVGAVEDFLGEVRGATGGKAPTFEQWHEWRQNLDRLAKFEKVNSSPAEAALQRMRGIMENELETAGEAAAKQVGGSFQAEYQANKALYQSLSKAEEMSARGVGKALNANAFGLTSRIAGIVGGAAGSVLGGPLGGLVGGGASALAGKLVQDRGDVMAADLLSRIAGAMGARRIAARAEARMSADLAALVGKPANDVAPRLGPPARVSKPTPMGVTLTGNARKDYQRVSSEAAKAVANPGKTTERLSASMGDLPTQAPKAAQAIITTTLRGASFLASKIPPSRRDPYTLQPQFQDEGRVSDAEAAKFMRYAHAVDDPLIVLREAKKGTLTREHVEAVKEVYPDLYQEMRVSVMKTMLDTNKEASYSKRIQFGILLDIPTDRTLAPDFMQAIQSSFPSAGEGGAESPPPTLSRPIQVASALETATQTATSEGLEK